MGDRLIAEYDHVGSRYLFYTPDQINSTRVVTDNTGTVVYSAAHDPYGGIQQTWVNTFDPTPKFSGKERDAESGLDYFGARYYDRSQYRFIAADPKLVLQEALADPQRWNLYAYCANNPVNLIDLSGKWGYKVHYTWTKRIAIMAGISESVAGRIAGADIGRDLPFAPMFTKAWHEVTTAKYIEALKICDTTLNAKELGKYLHVIQDYFAHYAIVFEGIEHTGAMDDPYSGYHEWSKIMDMVQLTFDIMLDYQERVIAAVVAAAQAIVASIRGI